MLECQDEFACCVAKSSSARIRTWRIEAKRILIASMQRLASRPNNDITATIVQLPNEDMKGRIIGREGRNIKVFEAATGVTSADRRIAADGADFLLRSGAARDRPGGAGGLVQDGRIHPASIEEFVKRAQEDVGVQAHAGRRGRGPAAGHQRLNPEVIKLLGRLKYRFSYTQNVLDHSVEVGFLCSLIASEVGLDPNLAKRAGLLHDIGKAVDGEYEGSHAHIGAEFIKRHGETPIVVNAVAAHHEEVNPETVYAGFVILADTVSRCARARGRSR
jgi:ribonuclease Y